MRRGRLLPRSSRPSATTGAACGATTPASSSPPAPVRERRVEHHGRHIEVLGEAIAQIPGTHRRKLLIRSDGAGASHKLLDWLTEQDQVRGRSVEYSMGFAITQTLREAIDLVPEKIWTPALDADGGIREGGDVAELTGLLDPATWPDGMRIIVRRERPHPGAQLSLSEERDGWRYQALATNTKVESN